MDKKCLLNEYILLLFITHKLFLARTRSVERVRGFLKVTGRLEDCSRRVDWGDDRQSRPLTFGNKHLSYSHCHCSERQSWEWKVLALELKYRILPTYKMTKHTPIPSVHRHLASRWWSTQVRGRAGDGAKFTSNEITSVSDRFVHISVLFINISTYICTLSFLGCIL